MRNSYLASVILPSMLPSMMKRRSISLSEKDYNEIKNFCEEIDVPISAFVESCIDDYFHAINTRPLHGNFPSRESCILVISYEGNRCKEREDLIQILVGKKGGTCEDGLAFVFNNRETSNCQVANEAKKRVVHNVSGVEANVWKYRIE